MLYIICMWYTGIMLVLQYLTLMLVEGTSEIEYTPLFKLIKLIMSLPGAYFIIVTMIRFYL